MSNYVKTAASGKYNCYFESCDGSFSDVDSLNDHLREVHGLSILKNAGKRSKMDLMLLEQIKQQRQDQANVNYPQEPAAGSSSSVSSPPMVSGI